MFSFSFRELHEVVEVRGSMYQGGGRRVSYAGKCEWSETAMGNGDCVILELGKLAMSNKATVSFPADKCLNGIEVASS